MWVRGRGMKAPWWNWGNLFYCKCFFREVSELIHFGKITPWRLKRKWSFKKLVYIFFFQYFVFWKMLNEKVKKIVQWATRYPLPTSTHQLLIFCNFAFSSLCIYAHTHNFLSEAFGSMLQISCNCTSNILTCIYWKQENSLT